MGFAVGQRPEPGALDTNTIDDFRVAEMAEARPPFQRDDAGGMIGKSGEDRDVVAHARPMSGQFIGARSRCSHFRGKVLREVKDVHEALFEASIGPDPVLEPLHLDGLT